MKWLINKRPIFYALSYLAFIIIFAIVYCFLPNQFYQSTRIYEKFASDNKSQKDQLYEEILNEMEKNIKNGFLQNNNDTFAIRGNYHLYVNNIKITDFSFSNESFNFKLYALPYYLAHKMPLSLEFSIDLNQAFLTDTNTTSLYRNAELKKGEGDLNARVKVADILFKALIIEPDDAIVTSGTKESNPNIGGGGGTGGSNTTPGPGTSTGPGTPDNGVGSGYKRWNYHDDSIILSQLTTNTIPDIKESIIRKIFFEKIYTQEGDLEGYFNFGRSDFQTNSFKLPISENLDRNLKSFALGLNNEPSSDMSWLKLFLKMLYFSIMTIATVGYGDIVPITAVARALVSTEVILGILFLGLFLNSLANKLVRSK